MKVTQRQLAETISELKKVARDLSTAADEEPVTGTRGTIVPVSSAGLRAHAEFLDRVAEELLELIDKTPVKVPPG